MEKTQRKRQTPALPKLIRVVLLHINAEHTPFSGSCKLTSKVNREFQLELLEPLETKKSPRILVHILTEGEWYNEDVAKPVITIRAQYEGRFLLPEKTPIPLAEEWMDDEFYRNSIIAQLYPVVNIHLFTQLEMMGLNTKGRSLGYEGSVVTKNAESAKRPTPRAIKKSSALKKS